MRALVIDGPGRLAVQERPELPLGPTDIRVRTESAGICGSDVHGYTGANQRRRPGTVMGHEAGGIVIERGSAVRVPELGQRVAINPAVTCGTCEFCLAGEDHRCPQRRLYGCVPDLPGAFADTVVIDALNAVAFQGPAPPEWTALVEPLAVGDHGVGLLGDRLPHGLLVVGGGPIGLGAALGARRRGVERVVVSEPNAHRRLIAGALGLDTWDPPGDDVPEPFDAAVECVGQALTIESALRLTRPGGEISIVGLGETTVAFALERLVVGERVVRGSFNYTRPEFVHVAEWVASGETDLSPMIEQRVQLDGLVDAFGGYADGSVEAVKTVFAPAQGPGGAHAGQLTQQPGALA